MSIEAINEQLLRSVGVGIALFHRDQLKLEFFNKVFESWFEDCSEGESISSVFPTLEIDNMLKRVEADGQYSTELKFKKKRRTIVVAQVFSEAVIGTQRLLVLECQNITRIRELESMIESYSSMVERNARSLQREKDQVEKLLLNIMPRAAYEEYRDFGVVAPQRLESVSVLVLGFVNFDENVEKLPPATLVSELNELYSSFDRIGEQLECERIRSTGGSYRCMAGMQDSDMDHLQAVATAATRFVRYLNRRNESADTLWLCRIGIGSGSVVGSVVGNQKYVYDIFGRAVNAAIKARSLARDMEVLIHDQSQPKLDGSMRPTEPQSSDARKEGLVALIEA